MLKSFYCKNYKNFREGISLNLSDIGEYDFSTDCLKEGIINTAIMYGMNASGKTNFGRALMDVNRLMSYGSLIGTDPSIISAEASAEEKIEFSYQLLIDGKEIQYQYSKTANGKLVTEEMAEDGQPVFSIDHENGTDDISEKFFHVDKSVIRQYWSEQRGNDSSVERMQIPFLRWVVANITSLMGSSIQKTFTFFYRMSFLKVKDQMGGITPDYQFTWFLAENGNVSRYEDFLKTMGVDCSLELQKLPEGTYNLYFKFGTDLIPYYGNASSGTMALEQIYKMLPMSDKQISFIYLDEFDAFYHYEMAEKIVRYLKTEYPQTQTILTTHNTSLLTNEFMRPDCLFIMSHDHTLTSLMRSTKRELREGHNLEKMYISGEFHDYE